MSDKRALTPDETVLRAILEELLNCDQDITAREVARRHPLLRAASSITRDLTRRGLLTEFQEKQRELRRWSARTQKTSAASVERLLADKDTRITELESQIEVLVASHIAMLRAVGELGGFSQWARFFEKASAARATLMELRALPPGEVIHLSENDSRARGC